jgi:hypothetical protein
MRRYPKHLGHLACDECGRERCEADDRDSWLITVDRGYLAETRCPACQAVEVELSPHAIQRWQERVRPGLSLEQAEDDLAHQLATNARWGDCPDWLDDRYQDADWLLLGDSIALPTIGGRVLTAFVRSTLNPYARHHTTNWNKFDRRARRANERSNKRKWEGKAAKRSRKRDKRWLEEAS